MLRSRKKFKLAESSKFLVWPFMLCLAPHNHPPTKLWRRLANPDITDHFEIVLFPIPPTMVSILLILSCQWVPIHAHGAPSGPQLSLLLLFCPAPKWQSLMSAKPSDWSQSTQMNGWVSSSTLERWKTTALALAQPFHMDLAQVQECMDKLLTHSLTFYALVAWALCLSGLMTCFSFDFDKKSWRHTIAGVAAYKTLSPKRAEYVTPVHILHGSVASYPTDTRMNLLRI